MAERELPVTEMLYIKIDIQKHLYFLMPFVEMKGIDS